MASVWMSLHIQIDISVARVLLTFGTATISSMEEQINGLSLLELTRAIQLGRSLASSGARTCVSQCVPNCTVRVLLDASALHAFNSCIEVSHTIYSVHTSFLTVQLQERALQPAARALHAPLVRDLLMMAASWTTARLPWSSMRKDRTPGGNQTACQSHSSRTMQTTGFLMQVPPPSQSRRVSYQDH